MSRDLGTLYMRGGDRLLLSCKVSGFPNTHRLQLISVSIDSNGVVFIENERMEDIPGMGLINVEAFSKTKAEK